jgi:hypothetical protein
LRVAGVVAVGGGNAGVTVQAQQCIASIVMTAEARLANARRNVDSSAGPLAAPTTSSRHRRPDDLHFSAWNSSWQFT